MAEARILIVEKGERLEYITLVWCSLEAVAALVAGILAGSVALMGFGIDSLIEVTSGGALLWRLHHDADVVRRQNAEHVTLRIVGACFILLAVYVACDSVWSLLGHSIPKPSMIGIAVTALSFVVMVLVAGAKRRVAHDLGSAAMNADASQTALCSYLCAIALAGLALNALFAWWWADPVAGLVMVPIIAREGLDALKGKPCCERSCIEAR